MQKKRGDLNWFRNLDILAVFEMIEMTWQPFAISPLSRRRRSGARQSNSFKFIKKNAFKAKPFVLDISFQSGFLWANICLAKTRMLSSRRPSPTVNCFLFLLSNICLSFEFLLFMLFFRWNLPFECIHIMRNLESSKSPCNECEDGKVSKATVKLSLDPSTAELKFNLLFLR